jgi:hypothetical protein
MCWSREVSLATGATSVGIASFLLFRNRGNDVIIALLSMAIAFMQFAEAKMWEFMETGERADATLGARMGITALFLQPLVLGGATAFIAAGPSIAAVFLLAGIILAAPLYYRMMRKSWLPPATVGCNSHLQWAFLKDMYMQPYSIFYWIVMLGSWIFLQPLWEGLVYGGIAVLSVLITLIFYPGEWGSFWCFLANALPILRLMLSR